MKKLLLVLVLLIAVFVIIQMLLNPPPENTPAGPTPTISINVRNYCSNLDAKVAAQNELRSRLLSPKGSNYDTGAWAVVNPVEGDLDLYGVTGYVDAMNAYGVQVRLRFAVVYRCEGSRLRSEVPLTVME